MGWEPSQFVVSKDRAPAMVPVIGPLLCDYTVFDYFCPRCIAEDAPQPVSQPRRPGLISRFFR